MKNDVKNGYRETPGTEIIEKWSKNAFFPSGTLLKKMKMIVFRVHFCKSEVRVPFYIHFSFILSFNFEKKWKQIEMENDWKMIEKWTKNANCEQPYCKIDFNYNAVFLMHVMCHKSKWTEHLGHNHMSQPVLNTDETGSKKSLISFLFLKQERLKFKIRQSFGSPSCNL